MEQKPVEVTLQDIKTLIQKWSLDKAEELGANLVIHPTMDRLKIKYEKHQSLGITNERDQKPIEEPFGVPETALDKLTETRRSEFSNVKFDKLTKTITTNAGVDIGAAFLADASMNASVGFERRKEKGTTDTKHRTAEMTKEYSSCKEDEAYQQFCVKQPMVQKFVLEEVHVSGDIVIKFDKKVKYNSASYKFDGAAMINTKKKHHIPISHVFKDLVNNGKCAEKISNDHCKFKDDKVIFSSIHGEGKLHHIAYLWRKIKISGQTPSSTPTPGHQSGVTLESHHHEFIYQPKVTAAGLEANIASHLLQGERGLGFFNAVFDKGGTQKVDKEKYQQTLDDTGKQFDKVREDAPKVRDNPGGQTTVAHEYKAAATVLNLGMDAPSDHISHQKTPSPMNQVGAKEKAPIPSVFSVPAKKLSIEDRRLLEKAGDFINEISQQIIYTSHVDIAYYLEELKVIIEAHPRNNPGKNVGLTEQDTKDINTYLDEISQIKSKLDASNKSIGTCTS